jgi:hypothetical protein
MNLRRRVLSGAAAGAEATLAMSVVMLGARRFGMVEKVAPEAITDTATRRLGLDPPERVDNLLAGLAHFGYGTGAGALYALASTRLPRRLVGAFGGTVFSCLLGVASYQGWVPAFGALPPLDEQGRGRQASLLLSHLTYGVALGYLLEERHDTRVNEH